MVRDIERKDLSTAAHTWRVVLYARSLAEALITDHDLVHRISLAAAVHDVGKLDISDAILQKPGPLTDDERRIMETHTVRGHDRLIRLHVDDPIALELVRHHHERIDGAGYPDGLSGHAISQAAMYFSVIDSFDAMTSLRPYRSDVGEGAAERAIDELLAGAGNRYCGDAVGAFVDLYRHGHINWILHYFNDSCPVPELGELGDIREVAKSGRKRGRR